MACINCGKDKSLHVTVGTEYVCGIYKEAAPTLPPSTGQPPLPPGFTAMIYVEATFGQVLPPINTRGWTPTTLLCISFTAAPASGAGNVSIAPLSPAWPSERIVSISSVAGDFNLPYPYTRHGQDCAIQFQVGGSSRTNCILAPGLRYFINYSWADPADARVQVSWPK